MNMNTHRSPQRKKGFSLIEILIVLVIIAALAAVVMVGMGGTAPRSRATADLSSLRNLQVQVDRFTAEFGATPSEWSATTGADKVLTAAENQTLLESIAGIYAGGGTLQTHSQANPVISLNEPAADAATRFTALVTSSGAGGGTRVVILQYRKRSDGAIVNGDQTLATTFLAAATAVAGPDFFDAGAGKAFAGNHAAWPY